MATTRPGGSPERYPANRYLLPGSSRPDKNVARFSVLIQRHGDRIPAIAGRNRIMGEWRALKRFCERDRYRRLVLTSLTRFGSGATVASKRREKIRSDARFADGWFEVSEDLWREPGEKPLKLKLLADANFPSGLVEVLKKRGIEVRTAQELKMHRFSDEQILQEAAKPGLFLITLDRDFRSDERFPLQSSGRLVFVDARDERIANTNGFELLVVLLKSLGWRASPRKDPLDRQQCVPEIPDGGGQAGRV